MNRKRLDLIWKVTKWEFNRFFKWKDMIKSVLFFIFLGLIGGIIGLWIANNPTNIPDVAVSDYNLFNPEHFELDEIRFIDYSNTPYKELVLKLKNGDVDAILNFHSIDEAEIRLLKDSYWLSILERFLQEKRTEYKLREYNIDEEIYRSVEADIVLNRHYNIENKSSVSDKVVAGIAISLVLMAVFMGFAYQFTTITAEKQLRITEQVISAISPQIWIDGKILGITGIGLIHVFFYSGLGLISTTILNQFGVPLSTALTPINPLFIVTFLILALLGILMWNSFLAGVAATIDDPNTSQRSGLMLLPLLPVALAFFTLINPDNFAIVFLGFFPLTSYAVLPARMVLSQVAWWEPVLALTLLAGAVWLFRVIAGKIFATSMMMYGKEPTLKEMVYWIKRV